MSVDPTAIQIPNNQALPSDMQLGLLPSAPKSRSYRVNVAPNNKQIFSPADVIYIDIPTGRPNTWYDPSQSYLKFSVQVQSTSAIPATQGAEGIYIDNSAYSFLQRLDVFNGSNMLETITQYGSLCNANLDVLLTQSDKAGMSSSIGTNPNNTFISSGATYAQNALMANPQVAGDRSGLQLASATAFSTAPVYTFSLGLLSGVAGVNASKMIPVGNLRAPLSLQLYTANNDDAIFYSTGTNVTWQIINVEFIATFVEIQDDNFGLHMEPGIPYYISTTSWRMSSFTVPSSTAGENTALLSFRCASLKNILGRFRNCSSNAQGGATSAYRLGSSVNPNVSYYYFKIGANQYPNKPVYLYNNNLVSGGSEAYMELLKSFHAVNNINGNTAIKYPEYNVAITTGSGNMYNWNTAKASSATTVSIGNPGTYANAFMIGQEFESFRRAGSILSGISTLNTNIFFTYGIQSGLTSGSSNIVAEFYAQFDQILVIQDGYISAKF